MNSGTRRRHVAAIRNFLQVKAFDEMAKKALLDGTREASLTKERSGRHHKRWNRRTSQAAI